MQRRDGSEFDPTDFTYAPYNWHTAVLVKFVTISHTPQSRDCVAYTGLRSERIRILVGHQATGVICRNIGLHGKNEH